MRVHLEHLDMGGEVLCGLHEAHMRRVRLFLRCDDCFGQTLYRCAECYHIKFQRTMLRERRVPLIEKQLKGV